MQKDWLVYLLKCSDNTLYCGATNDMDKRLKAHNSRRGAKYTKTRTPVELVAVSGKMSKIDALRLEYRVKKLKRDEKVNFLKENGNADFE